MVCRAATVLLPLVLLFVALPTFLYSVVVNPEETYLQESIIPCRVSS
jgi:hypothetical protein